MPRLPSGGVAGGREDLDLLRFHWLNLFEMDTSYNKYGFYLLMGVLLTAVLWIVYLMTVRHSIDLGEIEKTTAPEEGQKFSGEELKKPWISTQAFLTQGQKVYKAQCALCHGPKGLGDGSPGLVPPPRDLVEGAWKQGGSAEALFITLREGIAGSSMVSFKHLPLLDRWALVHYIHSITKNKVKDDPKKLEEFAKTAL